MAEPQAVNETVSPASGTEGGGQEDLSGPALQLRAATAEIDRLTRKLDESTLEIARLSRIVLAAQDRVAAQENVAATARLEAARWLGKAILWLHRSRPGAAPGVTDTDGLARLVRDSGLVDAAWYLQRYPDVAAAGMDPLQHYVLHGIGEGREPRDIVPGPAGPADGSV